MLKVNTVLLAELCSIQIRGADATLTPTPIKIQIVVVLPLLILQLWPRFLSLPLILLWVVSEVLDATVLEVAEGVGKGVVVAVNGSP